MRRAYSPECVERKLSNGSKIPPAPGLEIRSLRHGERRREARKQVAVVYASFASHALRAHEVLSRPDALASFLEVVHRLVKYGVFFGHERSIRIDSILPRIDGSGYPSGCPSLRLLEEEVQHVRLNVVWVGTDGRCADH